SVNRKIFKLTWGVKCCINFCGLAEPAFPGHAPPFVCGPKSAALPGPWTGVRLRPDAVTLERRVSTNVCNWILGPPCHRHRRTDAADDKGQAESRDVSVRGGPGLRRHPRRLRDRGVFLYGHPEHDHHR